MSSAAPKREVISSEVIPPEMDQHRIAWLATEGGEGDATVSRIRFATDGGKIYTVLREESACLRQIEGGSRVRISLGRGNRRVKGPEISGVAMVLAGDEASWARHLLRRKYWLLRVPLMWGRGRVLVGIRLI